MAVEKIILEIQTQVGKAKKDIDSLKNKAKGLNKEVNQTAKLMKKAGQAMLAFASIGVITTAIKNMVNLNIEFEKTLTNVLTLLDATTKAKFGDFLEAGSLRTMSKFGLEVNDVNKALFDTVSAGIKAGDSIKFLGVASKLAIAGVTDLSIAVDGMTSIMNAYALSIEDAGRVADAFFTAQKFGKTTVAELAQNVGILAPTMRLAGVGFEEMLAAMALLTKQGIQTDSATTALRATINALINATPAAEKAFADLGIATGITAIQTNGLGVTLGQVAVATEDNIDVLTVLIENVRALTAVAALGTEEGLAEYDLILKEILTDTGENSSAAQAFAAQMGTLRKRIDEAKGAWKELMITASGKGEGEQGGLKAIFGGAAIAMRWLTDQFNAFEDSEDTGGVTQSITSINDAMDLFILKGKAAATEMENLNKKQAEALAAVAAKRARPWWELDEDELTDRQKKLKKQWDAEGKDRIESLTDIQLEVAEIEMNMAQSTTDTEKLTEKARLDFLQQIADEEVEIQQRKTAAILTIVSNFAFAASAFATQGSGLQKVLAIADTTIATYASATQAYKAMAGIPVIGPVLAIAAASSAIAAGLANVAVIAGIGIPKAESFGKGGFTGKSKYQARDKDGQIAGYVHEDEFVFNKEKTRTLRPLFEDIHNNRIDIHGLAALTRRGVMKTTTKLNADILEQEVKKIYRKMSEHHPERASYIYTDHGYTKTIGNTTINVST